MDIIFYREYGEGEQFQNLSSCFMVWVKTIHYKFIFGHFDLPFSKTYKDIL